MSILEITGLTHSFGDNVLYKDTDFTLNKGEHVGVVGQNGTGKSTLIKICTEQIIPDAGRLVWQPKVTIGYLDQYAQINKTLSMREFLRSAFTSLYKLEKKMNVLYDRAANGNISCLYQASQYQEKLEQKDFYLIDTRIDQVAAGLGLNAIGLEQPIGQMSGGQKAKVILAKLLLEQPDVLFFDEPSNFLDKEHIDWLSDYLSGLENAFMVVSHDYNFLEKVATRICDIDNKKLRKYYGTYSEFTKKKLLLRDNYIRQYCAQQREIKKTEEFIRKNIAGRKSKMARGRQKQLNRLDRLEAVEQKEIKPYFNFNSLPASTAWHLKVKHLSIGYNYPILSDICFSIKGGEKVVITGFNGIGKSTLLKTLVGQIPSLHGEFYLSEQVVLSYFEQDLHWPEAALTPVQVVSGFSPQLTVKEVRKRLAQCGISSKHAMQPIGTLSGGEQTKVKICLLMLSSSNFMIMDEPTNHLDIQAKEMLKIALSEFKGTVLLVSHEEAFYKEWAQRVINIR